MGQKLKKTGCYLLIMVLLPYIVTVFLSGPVVMTSANVENNELYVKIEEEQTNISIKEYGIGILAKEIPADYEEEALKAQAVLVRTKLYKHISEKGNEEPLTDDFWTRQEMEEAWGITNYAINIHKIECAWEETEGQVLTYEENLAHVPYFRLSNGSTRDGKEVLGEEYSYLKIVECPLDIEEVEQMQTVTLDYMDAEVTACDVAGYVLNVRVGQENVSGEEFRKTYNLASSCFTLQKYEEKLRITTRGVGHGLGMSQNTANKMAKGGRSCQEILEYFFEGTQIKEVADFIQM